MLTYVDMDSRVPSGKLKSPHLKVNILARIMCYQW